MSHDLRNQCLMSNDIVAMWKQRKQDFAKEKYTRITCTKKCDLCGSPQRDTSTGKDFIRTQRTLRTHVNFNIDYFDTNTKKNQVGTLSTRILQVSRGTLNLSFVNHAMLKVGLQSRGRASFGASTNACRVWPEESSLYST